MLRPERAKVLDARASLTTIARNLTRLRLAVLAAISWPAPPPGYGPWEQVAFNVADGMRRRGLDVTLFAAGDSKSPDIGWYR